MTRALALWILLLCGGDAWARPPRLAVLLVVDQLSESHLQRRIEEGQVPTIAALAGAGFRYRDLRYEAAPALTAPGHATLSTGAYPELHGVVGNDWFDATLGRFVSCVEDPAFAVLGRKVREGDGTAATALRAGTLGASLKARYPRAKVVGVAGKNRGSILLAGPAADLALWLDPQAPRFTTSTAYAKELPAFVGPVNERLRKALKKGLVWSRPKSVVGGGKPDPWARDKYGFGTAFPHRVNARAEPYQVSEQVMHHPMVEGLVVDLALGAVDALELGKDDQPDLLTVSFSSFDKILHAFGPDSEQAQAGIEAVDQEVKRLLEGLWARVGKDEVVVALTSDHGGAPVAELLRQRGLDAGQVLVPELGAALEGAAQKALGAGPWLAGFKSTGYYAAPSRKERLGSVLEPLGAAALGVRGVRSLLWKDRLLEVSTPAPMEALYRRGLDAERSPDLIIVPRPYYMFGPRDAAGHGSAHLYDRQLPLILAGPGVRQGEAERAETVDVAPTLARLLGAEPPANAQGRVLREALLP